MTYCLNVSLMVYKNDLFWYITYKTLKWALKMAHLSKKGARTIFSTSQPILLKVHENYLFWNITINIWYEILKWALKTARLSQKLTRMILFNFWPPLIDSPWKQSTLIYYNQYRIWNFEISSKTTQLSSNELKMSRFYFFFILTPFYS